MYLQVASPGCTHSSYSHSISVRYIYLLMLFSFNILVSTFHCVWPAWMPANKPDIKWIWCELWPYTSCYRWLQTHQPTLHCATDPYTCAMLCYKQGGLPQVYHCYSGYIALLIWPLFSWCMGIGNSISALPAIYYKNKNYHLSLHNPQKHSHYCPHLECVP